MPTIKLLPRRGVRVATTRKKEYQEIYQDKRWLKLRNHKRRVNPLCERCESLGKVTPTKEVHHKIPFDVDPDLAFEWENLESLCCDCHEIRHKELKL
jgi:5-methylcytosine-specific restriction protein A